MLRAETLHGRYSYLEENKGQNPAASRFHEMSHGESFLAVLEAPGRYLRHLVD